MAAHYAARLFRRAHTPRDKAKVEVALLLTTRWIIAKLRNRRFFSIAELNDAIGAVHQGQRVAAHVRSPAALMRQRTVPSRDETAVFGDRREGRPRPLNQEGCGRLSATTFLFFD
jgi:hypothetical protein